MSHESRAILHAIASLSLCVFSLGACASNTMSASDGGAESGADAGDASTAPANFAWEALEESASFGTRFGAMVAPVGDGTYYVHGGLTGGVPDPSAHDTYRVEMRDGTPVFTPVATTNDPPGRSRGCMSYDPVGRRLIALGGHVDGFMTSDLTTWQLSLATGAWTRLETTVRPRGEIGCAMVWSARDNAALHFGGVYLEDGGGVWSNAVYRFDGATNQWSEVPATNPPSGRYDATIALSSDGNELLMFGGGVGVRSQGRFTADLFRFDVRAGSWSRLMATGPTPTPRRGHFMVVSPNGQRILVGMGESADEGLTDVWSYSRAEQRWSEVAVDNAQSVEPVHAFPAVFLGAGPGLTAAVMGGYDETGFPVSVAWRLRAPATLWP